MRITVQLSEGALHRYSKDLSVSEVKDQKIPLLLRYKADRTGSWLLELNRNGKTSRPKIGDWPLVSAAGARKQLEGLLLAVAQNETAKLTAFFNIAELSQWYVEREQRNASISKKYKTTSLSLVTKHILPRLGAFSVGKLDKGLVDEHLVQSMMEEGYKPSTIRQVYAQLKRILQQGADSAVIQSTALAGVPFKNFHKSKIKPKAGALRPYQLRDVIDQIKQAERQPRLFTLCLLCFGTRKTETSLIEYTWFDTSENPRLILPTRVTKTDDELVIPCSEFVMREVALFRKEQGGNCRYLFANARGESVGESTTDSWVKSVSGGKWSAHDLRKLATDCWIEAGVDYLVVQRLLNHALRGVDQAYMHSHLESRKREALEQWHNKIERLINSDTIPTRNNFEKWL
ncbi:tyrosine-type recombinase/integrase [Pseudoalteromonas sp. SCSIO 43201]|uniref:tyrosine-type recombinase/integrase n=1 Tax=Pseudoalteromonas sp. SCSIO 43201 TaxID=2822842 RepID=UPI00207580B3|nr:tyrosine-type recombinase/integrase [Pseudoalteromonas sp. SCSIO 43201]USD30897.1 tyrosine-type recombinase/integrase [Pseudoalteromonas sp. SCSIO 43201]